MDSTSDTGTRRCSYNAYERVRWAQLIAVLGLFGVLVTNAHSQPPTITSEAGNDAGIALFQQSLTQWRSTLDAAVPLLVPQQLSHSLSSSSDQAKVTALQAICFGSDIDSAPLHEISQVLCDSDLDGELRYMAMLCLGKVAIGANVNRARAAERILFAAWRDQGTPASLRVGLCTTLAAITSNDASWLVSVTEILCAPETSGELAVDTFLSFKVIVEWRSRIGRGVALACLSQALDRKDLDDAGRRNLLLAMSFLLNDIRAEPLTDMLLHDMSIIGEREFCNQSNSVENRMIASQLIRGTVRPSERLQEVASKLLATGTLNEIGQEACRKLIQMCVADDNEMAANLERTIRYSIRPTGPQSP